MKNNEDLKISYKRLTKEDNIAKEAIKYINKNPSTNSRNLVNAFLYHDDNNLSFNYDKDRKYPEHNHTEHIIKDIKAYKNLGKRYQPNDKEDHKA